MFAAERADKPCGTSNGAFLCKSNKVLRANGARLQQSGSNRRGAGAGLFSAGYIV
jgi:hypothetical protein